MPRICYCRDMKNSGQERKRNGQYGVTFSAMCACGRTFGEHMAEAPYDIDDNDHQCEGFRKAEPRNWVEVDWDTKVDMGRAGYLIQSLDYGQKFMVMAEDLALFFF